MVLLTRVENPAKVLKQVVERAEPRRAG